MTRIPMLPTSDYRRETYGILYESAFVYQTNRSSYPTRVQVWDNTRRVNPDPGGPIKYGEMGPLPTGGDGKYIDPHNKATDAERSILLNTEAISIDAHGTGTGTVESGQVWAPEPLRDGDTVSLHYPDRTLEDVELSLPRYDNGHGTGKSLGYSVA